MIKINIWLIVHPWLNCTYRITVQKGSPSDHIFSQISEIWSKRFFSRKAVFGDTDLIHVKWWAGGLALASQMNLTFSWPTCQFLSIPVIDTIGATVKQNKTKGYDAKHLRHLQRTKTFIVFSSLRLYFFFVASGWLCWPKCILFLFQKVKV